jgi:VWA domain-containing protein
VARPGAIIPVIVALGLWPMDGQGAGAQPPPFRSAVDVVTLSVTATDGAHRYVSDLDGDDFLVLEDGRPQRVTFFRKTGVSLALALLIDTSASMDQSLAIAREAAIGFVRDLDAEDVASAIDFDSRVQVGQDYTDDHEALERAIRRTAAGGSTSIEQCSTIWSVSPHCGSCRTIWCRSAHAARLLRSGQIAARISVGTRTDQGNGGGGYDEMARVDSGAAGSFWRRHRRATENSGFEHPRYCDGRQYPSGGNRVLGNPFGAR